MQRARALALAAALVVWGGLIGPRIPPRPQLVAHAVLAVLLVRATHAPLGLTPPALGRGVRDGSAAAAAITAAVAGCTLIPAVRRGMAARDLPKPTAEWLLLRIPIGTVWSEEAAFRAALGTVAHRAFGTGWGRLLQAITFGGKHIADARGAGEPVLGTVVVTGLAGWAFGWLHDRTGSLAAPMLAHLAVNEAGAIAAIWVRSRG